MCNISVVPGVYQTAETCEAAREKLDSRTTLMERFSVSGACLPAPDYVTYE